MSTVCSLFSGIGGIDLGFVQAGFKIVWANEKDTASCKTYRHNFGGDVLVEGDVRRIQANSIPDFDVLTAGFPCQPFSIAGKMRGFEDRRGNLFFEISRIVDYKRPKVVFLENVANLVNHDDGRTFLVIYNTLAQLGYAVYYKVMSPTEYANIPQSRKRIFIVAVHDSVKGKYNHPDPVDLSTKTSDIVCRNDKKNAIYYYPDCDFLRSIVHKITDADAIYAMHDSMPKPLKDRICPTLTASMGTHSNCVPILKDAFGIRKLTLRECLDFQGFPQEYYFPATVTIEDAYKQIGNSVCVPVVRRIAEQIKVLLADSAS